MRPLLVDSSVWIDFFKGRATLHSLALREYFGKRNILLGDLIVMEVLQGFREQRDVWLAEADFTQLPCCTLGGETRARRAAANYRHLRTVGVTPRSSIDVLIATFCVDEGVELLTSDRDFTLMAPHLGLELHQPATN